MVNKLSDNISNLKGITYDDFVSKVKLGLYDNFYDKDVLKEVKIGKYITYQATYNGEFLGGVEFYIEEEDGFYYIEIENIHTINYLTKMKNGELNTEAKVKNLGTFILKSFFERTKYTKYIVKDVRGTAMGFYEKVLEKFKKEGLISLFKLVDNSIIIEK